MKIFRTILLSFFLANPLYSQDIMLKDLEDEIITTFQKSTTKAFKLQNFSNTEKYIEIRQNIEEIQGGSTFVICYQDNCNSADEPLIVNLPPNSVSKNIELTLTGGLSNTNSIAYLEFIDMKVDKVLKKEIMLKVTAINSQDIFFEKGDIVVNSFFPNPAKKIAIMEYKISPFETEAKITLQNVLGSIVSTYELSPDQNKLNVNTENLSPGVYFYTLSIRDEGLATRKLIVKK